MTENSIKLTPLHSNDADEMFQVLVAPEIYKFIPDAPPKSIEELRKRYQTLARGSSADGKEIWLNWVIRKTEGDMPIGYVQATISRQTCAANIAYVLNPKYWRQGFAREAVIQMLGLLENEYAVRSFEAAIDWHNERSIKLLGRLGFKKSGEKATELADGTTSKDIIMELRAPLTTRVYSGAPWEKQVGYCRAVKRGNFISVSGTAPIDENGSVFEPNNAFAQTKRCIEIIERCLGKIGSDLSEVVRTRMFVTDISRWEDFGRAHEEAFRNHPPATSMVEVKSLIAPEMLIEIEADAVVGTRDAKDTAITAPDTNAHEMLNHLSIGVSNLERSITSYSAALRPLGYSILWNQKGAAGYGIAGQDEPFAIKQEEAPTSLGSSPKSHIAFTAKIRQAVSDFHQEATKNGGRNLGEPGLRPHYGEHCFAAFVGDPDGYKIEAVCHSPLGSEQ